MLEKGRAVHTWLILLVFATGAVWSGGKGVYVEARKFFTPPPKFNPWESSFMLGYWVVALVGGLVLLAWIIRSLARTADEKQPRS